MRVGDRIVAGLRLPQSIVDKIEKNRLIAISDIEERNGPLSDASKAIIGNVAITIARDMLQWCLDNGFEPGENLI